MRILQYAVMVLLLSAPILVWLAPILFAALYGDRAESLSPVWNIPAYLLAFAIYHVVGMIGGRHWWQ